ncbi:MAG: hypothetical protein ACREP7_22750, partial [Lysobacter sp.]
MKFVEPRRSVDHRQDKAAVKSEGRKKTLSLAGVRERVTKATGKACAGRAVGQATGDDALRLRCPAGADTVPNRCEAAATYA